MNNHAPSAAAITNASSVESAAAYPHFEQLRRPFELGFRAGVRWLQSLTQSARRGDTRMIGSALDILGDPEHRAKLERHIAEREIYEPAEYRDGPRHVIVGDRQEGKTTVAERWLLDAPIGVERVLVTFSIKAAEEIRHRLGFERNDHRVTTFHSLIGPGRSAKAGVEYGFDETVRILEQLLRLKQPPHLLTITTAAAWQGRDT